MTSGPAPTSAAPAHDHLGHGEGVVCPFCAHVRPADAAGSACPRCTMQDTASTRRSTGERIGPWFVLQRKNPTAPGLRFSVLLTLARRGHVTPRSIVRGPTTGQLWRYAAQVKGLSRIFGVCWHCGGGVSPDAQSCPRCRSAQEIPDDPDVFLESYASLPVMRETPAAATSELSAPAPAPALGGPTFGTRQITAATGGTPAERRLAANAGRPGSAERRIVPPTPPAPRQSLPSRRPPPAAMMPTGIDTGQAIMSASELAAVFQLEQQRPGLIRRTGRLAWRLTRVAAVFAVVVGIGGVAVAYLKPDWAAQARAYAEPRGQAAWAKVSAWTRTHLGSHAAAADANAVPATPAAQPIDRSTPPPTTPIVLATTASPADAAAAHRNNAPTSNQGRPTVIAPTSRPANPFPRDGVNAPPAASVSPQLDGLGGASSTFTPATTKPTNAIVIRPTPPAPAPAIANPAPAPQPTPPPASARREPTLDEAITQATALRNDALDAEARRDWKGAVIIYEQIMRLPEAAWPSDVKPRLEVARQKLAAS